MPKKKKKLTVEKVRKAYNILKKKITDMMYEVDEINKFVKEAISIFVTDTRFMRDEIMILAERLAELDEMSEEYQAKKQGGE